MGFLSLSDQINFLGFYNKGNSFANKTFLLECFRPMKFPLPKSYTVIVSQDFPPRDITNSVTKTFQMRYERVMVM